jgi:hypothetical protein
MNENHRSRTPPNVALAVGVGAVVGVVAGLLLAPRAGNELRHGLRNAFAGLGERLCELGDRMLRRLETTLESGARVAEGRGWTAPEDRNEESV